MRRVILAAALLLSPSVATAQENIKTWDLCFNMDWNGQPGIAPTCAGFAAIASGPNQLTMKFWNYSGLAGTNSTSNNIFDGVVLGGIPLVLPPVQQFLGTFQGGGLPTNIQLAGYGIRPNWYSIGGIGTGPGGMSFTPGPIGSTCPGGTLLFPSQRLSPCAAPNFADLNDSGWLTAVFDLPVAVPTNLSGAVLLVSGGANAGGIPAFCGSSGTAAGCDLRPLTPAEQDYLATIPEPSTYVLMAAGLAALGVAARRRRLA
jgi:hypothetical protein